MIHDPLSRLIEALLFASDAPMSVADLRARVIVGGMALEEGADFLPALEVLRAAYAGRGVNLVEVAGGWAFRTAQDLGVFLAPARAAERKISRVALETLAIIAYHQPVTRAEIENIRGVATSKGTLDVLLEAGWIKTGRRREAPGRPLTWVTTQGFLDHFGLEALRDLPGLEEMKDSGLLDPRPAIETLPNLDPDAQSEDTEGMKQGETA